MFKPQWRSKVADVWGLWPVCEPVQRLGEVTREKLTPCFYSGIFGVSNPFVSRSQFSDEGFQLVSRVRQSLRSMIFKSCSSTARHQRNMSLTYS